MPYIIRHNLSLKILSIVGAIAIWAAVRTQTDPIVEQRTKIHVFTTAAPEGMQVLKVEPSDVHVSLRGRRSVFESEAIDALKLVADVADAQVGEQSVPIRIEHLHSGLELVSMERQRVQVVVDKIVIVSRAVQAHTRGRAAEGFAAKGWQVQPNEVTISGAAANVHRVTQVLAVVDISGASATVKREVRAQARDENNVTVDGINVSPEKVTVSVPIQRVNTKTVPIKPVIGQVPSGWELVQVQRSPTTVTLAGSGSALAGVTAVDTAPVDISDLRGTSAYSVPLQVPSGIEVLGAGSARVTVTLRRLGGSRDATGAGESGDTADADRTQPGQEGRPAAGEVDRPGTEPSQADTQRPDSGHPKTDADKPKPESEKPDAVDGGKPPKKPAETAQPPAAGASATGR